MSAVPALPKIPGVPESLGTSLIGTYSGLLLYGMSLLQTWRYFVQYPNDRLVFRLTVIIMTVFNTLHSVLFMHTCYYYLILKYFHPEVLPKAVWSTWLVVPSSIVIVLIGEAFYALRVYRLGGWRRYVAIIATLLMAGFVAFELVAAYELARHPEIPEWAGYTWLTSAGFSFSFVADIGLCVSLCIFLHTNRTGFKNTDSVLNMLLVYTVNTGFLIWQVNDSRLFGLKHEGTDNLTFVAVGVPTVKAYPVSVLAILNSRSGFGFATRSDNFASFGMDVTQPAESPTRRVTTISTSAHVSPRPRSGMQARVRANMRDKGLKTSLGPPSESRVFHNLTADREDASTFRSDSYELKPFSARSVGYTFNNAV
ncbi:uncharacterized protein BXZ73DRAFT_100996 [Epithele typhae]|uniref:uncharacterized protein n=1 Tax=Epithele typhae TaxID=378194 RepID=UPI0020075147|nr:uncharacterized protein BXZ73DRAFT_100996 [Epithele typhae]KAH9933609.1 hypothetical protein BXZ73DRAFT_100996 [Epithele typhae]